MQAQRAPSNRKRGREDRFPPYRPPLEKPPLLRFGRWCPSYSLLKCGPLPEAAFEEPRRKGRYWLRRSGKPRLYAGRSVHVLVHRLALVLLELREHEVVLVVHEELRRALHVHEEGIHLADILHVDFLPLALDAHEVRCGDEMQRVTERALRADLRQKRLRIFSHFHVLLLGTDVDDAPSLVLAVRLRGDDEHAVQEVDGDPVRALVVRAADVRDAAVR